jgi:plastocyanin
MHADPGHRPLRALLATLFFAAAACTDAHREATAPEAGPVRLQVGATATLAAEATLLVRVTYTRRDGTQAELGRQTATIAPGGTGTSGGTQAVSLTFDIAPCLADSETANGRNATSCPAQVQIQLLRGTSILDEVQRAVTLVPGQNATLGEALSLFEVTRVSAQLTGAAVGAGTPPRIEIGQRVNVTATAFDRTGAIVPDRTFAWSTTTPNAVRLNATTGGTITIDVLSATSVGTIRVSSGDREGVVTFQGIAESARTVSLRPSDTTVFVGDTVRYTAEARGSSQAVVAGATFQYSSSSAIATITAQGVAVARAAGQGTITATTNAGPNGSAVSGTTTLSVLQRPVLIATPPTVELTTEPGKPLPSRSISVTGSVSTLAGLNAEVLGGLPVTATFDRTTTPASLVVTATTAVPAGTIVTGIVRLRSTTSGVQPLDVAVTLSGLGPAPIIVTLPSVDFGTLDSGSVASPTNVGVTTTAGRSVAGLTASVAYTAGGSPGWLSATFDRTTTSATLILQPRLQGLAPGTYRATVTVGTVDGSGTASTVNVSLTVLGAIELRASPVSIDVGVIDSGTVSASRAVAISTRDGRVASGLTTSTSYGAGNTVSWLGANLSGGTTSTTLQLVANTTGLRPGSYSADVTVRAATPASTRPVQIPVTLTVRAADSLVVTPAPISFGDVEIGTGSVTRSFSVGTLQNRSVALVTTLQWQYLTGTSTNWLTAALQGSGTPTTGSVTISTAGLQPGLHTAIVTVRSTSPGVRPTTFVVSLNAYRARFLFASTPRIPLGPIRSQSVSQLQTTTISTTDTSAPVALLNPSVTYAAGERSGWLTTAALNRSTTAAVLSLQASSGSLPAGTYNATVTVSSPTLGVRSVSVPVQLVVSNPNSIRQDTRSSTAPTASSEAATGSEHDATSERDATSEPAPSTPVVPSPPSVPDSASALSPASQSLPSGLPSREAGRPLPWPSRSPSGLVRRTPDP